MANLIDWKTLEEKPYKPLAELSRRIAAEGCVLLKNEGNVLPLGRNNRISLFGRTQIDYYKSGTGSGGLVNVDYTVNILEGIRGCDELTLNEELVGIYESWIEENPFDNGPGWAQEPWCQKEMVPEESVVKRAAEISDTAVIVLGRTAGEDRDNSADKGSWYLTDEEEALLDIVSRHFDRTAVLLNVGNIIDMKWVEKYNIKAVMYVWQGGQEGGNAAADVLCGRVTPCGKLTDTIAADISLYPSTKNFGNKDFNLYEEDIYVGYRYFETFAPQEVLYPFGFGLSYTSFEKNVKNVSEKDGRILIEAEIKNTGAYSGREIVQVYFEAPQGRLGKSARELCAFAKTGLLAPGEKQTLNIEFNIDDMACYDDGGVTGNKSCYVLEAGEYAVYAGGCVRCAEKIYTHTEKELRVTKQLTEVMAPVRELNIMHPLRKDCGYEISYKKASMRTVDYDKRIAEELPAEIAATGDRGIKLADAARGEYTMQEFTAQLSDDDLMCLIKGEGMSSPKVRPGSAGAVGGVTASLAKFGIPIVALHDGPSGIRMDNGDKATSLPNGTLIACTWDTAAAYELYKLTGIELCTHKVDSLLGPGINIHRSPLNGRNFEYFSEDPYITGKMAAALIKGMSVYGCSATVKHFAANSQEYRRKYVDAVMSERAAREIYLKGFETAVKEGGATSLMTSYNPINGIWSANNYELNTIVLRKEWGYTGFVVTDWWPTLKEGEKEGEPKNLKNLVEAQNDVYMPTADALTFSDNLKESLEKGLITRGQLQRNAMNILRYIANSHALERFSENTAVQESVSEADIDGMTDIAVIENPENEKAVRITAEKAGKYILCVEYSSEEPEISQMVINAETDGAGAASITVNGSGGRRVTVNRGIELGGKETQLVLKYPDTLVKIHKISIKTDK